VAIEMDRDVLAEIFDRNKSRPGWLDTYGTRLSPMVFKVLTNCGHEYYCATNDSLFELEPNRILGVVRRIERAGVALYVDPPECSMISPFAATNIIINNNNSSGTGITGITGLSSLGVVVSNTGIGFDFPVIVTATIQARQTAGVLGDVKLLLRYTDDNGSSFTSSAQELKIMSASFQTYTLQWQFQHHASNVGLNAQASIWSDSGNVADSYDWQLATLQLENVIK
jgi:hypothetical protein